MTIDSFFIHTLFCFLHNIHLHVILVFFLTLIFHFYLFSLMKLSRQLIPLRQISLELLIFKPPPPWKKCNKILQYFINKKLPKRLLFALLTLFFTFLNEVIYASGYVIVFWLSNAIHGCTLNEIIQQKAT